MTKKVDAREVIVLTTPPPPSCGGGVVDMDDDHEMTKTYAMELANDGWLMSTRKEG